jgi:hypothetical protein
MSSEKSYIENGACKAAPMRRVTVTASFHSEGPAGSGRRGLPRRVDSSAVDGVRHGHRIVAIDRLEQLCAARDVGAMLAEHHLRQMTINAVTQNGHLSHGQVEGGFSRCVGCPRDRSWLKPVLPLE